MPMIVPPTDWTGPQKGGYRWLEVGLMRTHGSNVQKEALLHADLSSVCDGLNILGKTAWRINKKILEVGEYCWNNNIPIGDIPSRDDFDVPPETPRPSFDIKKDTESGEDPEFSAKMASLQAYRDAMSKRQRIQQKNMVCCIRRD
jgi:DNA-directed RNA polymerase